MGAVEGDWCGLEKRRGGELMTDPLMGDEALLFSLLLAGNIAQYQVNVMQDEDTTDRIQLQ